MRVLLVGNYAPDRHQSMQRFAGALHAGLAGRGHEVTLLLPPPRLGRLRPGPSGLGKWLGYWDKFAAFPHQLRAAAARAEVVHICDHSNAMYCAQLAGRPHLVTCHDLLAVRSALGEIPENPVRWTGRRLQAWVARGLMRAQRIACISQATRADVERVLAVPAARLAVVPNGPNHPYRPFTAAEVARCLAGLPGAPAPGVPYLFHIGSNAWYKNRAGVIRIAGALDARGAVAGLRLVFAGQRLDAGLRALVGECGLTGRVDELGEVGNDQLNALYSGALGLLFPSLAEGFGWPIVEAQAAGCVVFLSARPPLTEVGGEAAVQLDPCDPPAAAAAIAANLERLAELRHLGLANAARFSTTAMLDGYERQYREVQP